MAETVQADFKQELEFLEVYDSAFAEVRDIVDMPGRRASFLIRLCSQNGGRLSANKRKLFDELTDKAIVRFKTAIAAMTEVYSGI